MTDKIRYGQTIFDFCVWKYGTIQEIIKLVADNGLNYSADVKQGVELSIENDFGNEDIKDFFTINNFIPSSEVKNDVITNFVFEDLENYVFEDGENFIFEN